MILFPLFATGVIDTVGKFAAGVVDTGVRFLRLRLNALCRGCRWPWSHVSVFCVVVLPYLYIDSLSVGGGGAGQRQESREGKLPARQ